MEQDSQDALGRVDNKLVSEQGTSGQQVRRRGSENEETRRTAVSKGGHRKITESGTQCIPRRAVLTERRVWCDRLVYKCTTVWGRTGQSGAVFGANASVRAALPPVEKCMPMHANSVIRQTVRR